MSARRKWIAPWFAAWVLGGCVHHEPPQGPLQPEWSDAHQDQRPHAAPVRLPDEPTPPLGWERFSAPEGDFTVWLPGTPRETTAPPTYRRFALDTDTGRYTIASWELDPAKAYTAADDEVARHLANGECDHLIDKDLTIHGQPAHLVREKCATEPPQFVEDARFVIGSRLYHLELITDGEPGPDNARTFVESFAPVPPR